MRAGEEVTPAQSLQRSLVSEDMQRQPVVMSGVDEFHRAVLLKSSRQEAGVTKEQYLTTQLYIAERAMACTEYASRGTQEKVVAVFDFGEASVGTPPLRWQIDTIRILQKLYPERLHKLVVLQPPFLVRNLFKAMKPILSKATTEKISVASDR